MADTATKARPNRSPTVRGRGLAQQTLVEHALCPLDVSSSERQGSLYEVRYDFTDKNRNRKHATARIAAPFGLSPHDELYLYGLLALTFSQKEPTADFYATPHWCLKQLGIVGGTQEQGKRYRLFREAIRRLAGVVYENDRFYAPVRGEHRQVAMGLLKYSLPLDETSGRAWHFVWDPQWFSFCQAIAGSFTFDFRLYRELDVASRRLFLLLSKIFWRNDSSPAFELRSFAINTLGFAPTLRTAEIKRKLLRTARTLLDRQILSLPIGTSDTRQLFVKRRKGVFEVRFHRGAYFDAMPDSSFPLTPEESPLAELLARIGFDAPTIGRLIQAYPARLIAEWSDITLAALERKLIKESPQAFFRHYIREAFEKRTTPPDWWRELRKQELERDRPQIARRQRGSEEERFNQYLREEAQDAFQTVMGKLFRELRDGGQSEPEAHRNAEQFARMHFRQTFRREHPESGHDKPSAVRDFLPTH